VKFIVIARSGVKRGRFFDGQVVPQNAKYLRPFRQVFGPARRTSCIIWKAANCDPLPDWRNAERRVVHLAELRQASEAR
jgi:hypothetical protein